MQLGRVAAIYRYPVKSLRAASLEQVEIAADGLPGDRARALSVRDGHARAGKTYRGKEHDRLHLADDVDEAVEMAARRGVAVVVRDDAPHFFDAAPVSLIVDRWLDGLRAELGYHVQIERFRPNIVVAAHPSFAAGEVEILGATIRLGGAVLHVREPIGRCVTTTYDPHGGEPDPRILRYVARERDNVMGVYCDVLEPGLARRGDTVRLVA
ncbi:MAG TPA: MOSC domain-containing protein [Candidatus Aquilonibacter sp.]